VLDLRTHTLTSAPDAARPLLRGLQEAVGFVPNLAARMSESPALLSAFLGLREAYAKGSLDVVTRELIAITVATETGCTYCVAARSNAATSKAPLISSTVAMLLMGFPGANCSRHHKCSGATERATSSGSARWDPGTFSAEMLLSAGIDGRKSRKDSLPSSTLLAIL